MKISLKDLKFLLECEEKAHASIKIGYVGAEKTAQELVAELNAKVEASNDAVEAALFSLYQLLEKGYSINLPDKHTFDSYVKRLTPPGYKYDKELGCFYRG